LPRDAIVNGAFDTHAHFETFSDAEAAEVIRRAGGAGVDRIVAVGGNPRANAAVLRVAEAHVDRLRAAVGFDRDCVAQAPDLAALETLIRHHSGAVVAMGELGLDYHYAPETAGAQRHLMEAELDLARRLGLPVIVHSRDADADTVALLTAHAAAWTGDPGCIGVLHCFTEDEPFAHALLDLGFMISFSGIVTFRNADPLRAVARGVPADRLLIETDTPYLAPVPYRGQPNEPAFLPAVAECLARVRGETVAAITTQTSVNALRLFGWGS
jgi:TatD DNase family protein